jgi:anti-sigma regulatory factor (Ser/Thr protein kinase)
VVVSEDRSGARRLRLEADVDRLADVRTFVRASAAELGASKRAIDDLVQAVDEAACNVMQHGYGDEPGPLDVEVERRGDAIAVTLSDRARPFDPTGRPISESKTPAQPTGPGHMGVGVKLLRTMMDEVHHSTRPDGGNELTLVRSIDGPAGKE